MRTFAGFSSALICVVHAGAALAQPAAPAAVTPPTLAPERRDNGFRVEIPEAGALLAPQGAESLGVTLDEVRVEGGFAEVAGESGAVAMRLAGRRSTLADVFAAASEIEGIHARAGYVLARVSVPPQQLAAGSALRIVVTDGFIESVDVSGLPQRVRGAVRARAAGLEGRRHLRLSEIEQPLLLASDIPGLTMRSTLMRGNQPGGTRLVLEGAHRLLTGSLGAGNPLDPSLGRWGVNLQLSLNSALGLGEQIYGFVSSDYNLGHLFGAKSRERVVGGGAIVPLGDGRFSLNPEVTFARTMPEPAFGAPTTVGHLRRLSLRLDAALERARRRRLALGLTLEQIEEDNLAPDFNFTINHDRYMAARLGLTFQSLGTAGNSFAGRVQLSHGLGGLAAISAADALASGVPYSRVGASTSFTKAEAALRGDWTLGGSARASLAVRGQTAFGKPLLRAEQFALEGADGLSAYVGGVTAVDEGAVARAELGTRIALGADGAQLAPYVFAAGGSGRIARPSALEPGGITAGAFGLGARIDLGRFPLSLELEYARGVSGNAALSGANRANISATFRF